MTACFHLRGQGIAIARRTALDDVGDVHVVAREPDRGDELVQQLARWSNKRPSLLVFVVARTLSNEHDLGVWGPFTGNHLGAVVSKPACLARAGRVTECAERGRVSQKNL